jgi:hypothetical protein
MPGITEAAACSFCASRGEGLIAGRRTGAPARAICARCARTMRADSDGARCDFCDHPDAKHARKGDVSICGGCLDLAREAVHDSMAPAAGPEGRIDTALLWSDLTPAPVPVVDGDAPATAHAELALALLQMGLVEEARVETQKALAMDATHAIALRVQAKLAALDR